MLELLVFLREARSPAERASFYRAIQAGALVRVVRGVGVPAELWQGLSAVDRYLARIHAVAATSTQQLVFSHAAAAALWRMPWYGPSPARVDATFTTGAGRSTTLIRAHVGSVEAVPIDGLLVTPLARTVVDIARTGTLENAVVIADAALAARRADGTVRSQQVTAAALLDELAVVSLTHGSAKAREALRHADGRSGSPGESVSRVSMVRIGIPAPELQKRFPAPGGRHWEVDFWWPEFKVIGEFDGLGKYLRTKPAGTVADEVIAEKWREDGLRALGPTVTRWGWSTATSVARLRAHLLRAGLTARPIAGSSTDHRNDPGLG